MQGHTSSGEIAEDELKLTENSNFNCQERHGNLTLNLTTSNHRIIFKVRKHSSLLCTGCYYS